jgi:hypothetical protein
LKYIITFLDSLLYKQSKLVVFHFKYSYLFIFITHAAGLVLHVAEDALSGECPNSKSSSRTTSSAAPEQSGSSTHLAEWFWLSDLLN